MKLAAIDIGSNSIKLVVVDAASADSFAVLARDKETVRLGHETLREGYLSPAAVERAAECVKRFRSIAEARASIQLPWLTKVTLCVTGLGIFGPETATSAVAAPGADA